VSSCLDSILLTSVRVVNGRAAWSVLLLTVTARLYSVLRETPLMRWASIYRCWPG